MVQKRLKEILIESIESGYRFFGSGGARGFDTVAAMAVLEFKKVHPDIKLILVLPCREQTRGWSETDVQKHKCTTTPPKVYSFERRHCSVYSDEGVQFTTAEVFNLAAVFKK